ncbi:hypothetical protein EAO77_03135 [Streptomyces sp. t39]|nr:hypothetical protein EAO77_03135 [Streptomyces sp. t39]
MKGTCRSRGPQQSAARCGTAARTRTDTKGARRGRRRLRGEGRIDAVLGRPALGPYGATMALATWPAFTGRAAGRGVTATG